MTLHTTGRSLASQSVTGSKMLCAASNRVLLACRSSSSVAVRYVGLTGSRPAALGCRVVSAWTVPVLAPAAGPRLVHALASVGKEEQLDEYSIINFYHLCDVEDPEVTRRDVRIRSQRDT